jgi:hypothetical protein
VEVKKTHNTPNAGIVLIVHILNVPMKFLSQKSKNHHPKGVPCRPISQQNDALDDILSILMKLT